MFTHVSPSGGREQAGAWAPASEVPYQGLGTGALTSGVATSQRHRGKVTSAPGTRRPGQDRGRMPVQTGVQPSLNTSPRAGRVLLNSRDKGGPWAAWLSSGGAGLGRGAGSSAPDPRPV